MGSALNGSATSPRLARPDVGGQQRVDAVVARAEEVGHVEADLDALGS